MKKLGPKMIATHPVHSGKTLLVISFLLLSIGVLPSPLAERPLQAVANGPYYAMVDEPILFTPDIWGGCLPYTILWEFGDGGTADQYFPTHSYDYPGFYYVTLSVTDACDDFVITYTNAIIYYPLKVSTNGPYQSELDTPLQFHGSATGGTQPYTWYWEFGDGATSLEQNPTHTYHTEGDYSVMLTVSDYYNQSSVDETTARIIQENTLPEKPRTPTGPTSGIADEYYNYETSTIDPDGDMIWYWFDWGDGTNSGWGGPYVSGETWSAAHAWTAQGDYEITVKAKDELGSESPWSDPLSINIPKHKLSPTSPLVILWHRLPLLIQLLLQFFI